MRTLHHYEETGLLASSGRTDGGHRVYDFTGAERIYQIRALRDLGLSLAEIRPVIDGQASLDEILRAHLAQVEKQIEHMTVLRDRLSSLTSRADSSIDADDLFAALDAMSFIERHARLRKRDPSTSKLNHAALWKTIGEELRGCMESGRDPADPQTLEIARQARALIQEFAGGDPAVLDALAHLRSFSPPRDLQGWNPDLMHYLDLALAALPEEGSGS